MSNFELVNIPVNKIKRIKVIKKGMPGKGLLIGGAKGLVLGGAIGFLSGDDNPADLLSATAEEKAIALGLLLNIVFIAIFSAPFSFQKFAFEQPNIAVLFFPFSWLPAFIVPVVLFCHLASIRQLIKHRNENLN